MPDWQVAAVVRRVLVTVLVLTLGSTRVAAGQFASLGGKTAGAEVLVIGTYHMSNPRLDDVNLASVMVWALTHGQPELAGAAQSLTSRLLTEADSMMKHATVSEIIAALNSPRADSCLLY